MDANSFVILAAVVTLFSFNLTASLMCCRSLGKRVDRLEGRMDRFEQVLMQLVVDMALVKSELALVKSDMGVMKSELALVKSDMGVMKSELALVKSDIGVMKSDMGLVKAKLGIETASSAVASQPAIVPESGASSGTAAQ